MIFRRIKAHIEKENWFAVFIDFAIVVFGVFIGIQVANWNEARSNAGKEVVYLLALNEDLEASTRYAEAIIGNLTNMQRQKIALADHITGNKRLDLPVLDKVIHDSLYPLPILDVSLPTYTEMKASGVTPLLRDRNLRLALQGLDASLEQVRQAEKDKFEIYFRFSDPYLIKNLKLNTLAFAVPAADNPGPRDGLRNHVFVDLDPLTDQDSALQTVEFKNILIYRYNADANHLNTVHDLQKKFQSVQSMLEQQLNELRAS